MSNPPATPQRATKPSHHHSHSVSQSHFRSPLSPSSPYTPLSLRSFTSSTNPSPSILTTPGSFHQSSVLTSPPAIKKISFHSPQITRSSSHHEKSASVADIAPNWRCRASVNGIRVSASAENSYLDDYDVSISEDYSVASEEALLPPPFLSTQRRRALSQSHANPPAPSVTNPPRTPARQAPPSSPVVRKTLSNLNNAVTATPPPKRNLAQQLKLKGSQTDPPHTRRREAFGVVHPPSQNIPKNNDTSFDLFDIDENDYEFEYQAQDQAYTNQQSLFFDQDEYELELEYPSIPVSRTSVQHPPISSDYPAYPPGLRLGTVHVPASAQMLPLFGQPTFADPGVANSGRMADSVERYWSQYHHHPQYNAYAEYTRSSLNNTTLHLQSHPQVRHAPSANQGLRVPSSGSSTHHRSSKSPCPSHDSYHSLDIGRASSASPAPSQSVSLVSHDVSIRNQKPTSCSVCSRSQLARLAILSPCGHPLCSSCLTSALNIVGEKDMTCVVAKCGKPVEDFSLVSVTNSETTTDLSMSVSKETGEEDDGAKDFAAGLDSAFDFTEVDFDLPSDVEQEFDLQIGLGMRASTPPPASASKTKNNASGYETKNTKSKEPIVLRIDNVPWDITPPRIIAWLQQPIEHVHVLLDRKGKTMSHAYVEVTGEEIAGAILRGEVQVKTPSGQKDFKMRGSILGKGRRARGVTLTRSSQEELMGALFPAWQGTFDGARPSLAGLTSDRVISALENGLMTEGEVASLLYLIRSPDAHFLKVPSLPFYVLVSVLRKFPADADSRVFWSAGLRDVLFDVAFAAVQVLVLRVEGSAQKDQSQQDAAYAPELVEALTESIILCQVFTPEQTHKVQSFVESSKRSGSAASQVDALDASDPVSSEERSRQVPGQDGSDADIEDEGSDSESVLQDVTDKDDDEVRTPSSATVASTGSVVRDDLVHAVQDGTETTGAVDMSELAREFGVEAQLVQALAARLAGLRQA